MDQQIVGSIIRSSQKVMENYKNNEEVDESIKTFPVIDKTIVTQLASSLTDLLTYKVSQEAYHRYSVRLQIINTLRDWVRPPLSFDAHQIFLQDDILSNFLKTTVKKNFRKNEIENLSTDREEIVILCKSLINLAKSNQFYVAYLKKLIDYVCKKKLTCSDELLNIILQNQDSLQLDFLIIEKLYVLNAKKFIEDPLIDFFIENSNDILKKKELPETPEFRNLIKLISESPKIFVVCSSILCQLFLRLNHSICVVNYSQYILKKLKIILGSIKKNLIDFYPIKLRSCVLLMEIESCYHTENSRTCLLQMLKVIYDDNLTESLILFLHYPQWLEDFYLCTNNNCF